MTARSLAYRPALEGLRGVAVAGVLLYHAGVSLAPGGFLGVDVFFVLSGYLITSLLLVQWRATRRFDIRAFYAHRARRLLPALFAVTIAVALWAALFAEPEKRDVIRADGLSSLLYLANWKFIIAGQSYFDHFGDPSPFRHMWSLAIEGQFYLIYPWALWGLLQVARGRRWIIVGALSLACGLSILAMSTLFVPGSDPSRAYYGTDTRAHELLLGAILRVALLKRPATPQQRSLGALLAPVALLSLVTMFVTTTESSVWLYRGGFALVGLASAALICGCEWAPANVVSRGLASRPMRTLGTVSYGLYLWHWPVFIALSELRTGLSGLPLLALRLLVTGAVTAVSYRVIEGPFRRARRAGTGRWELMAGPRRLPLAPALGVLSVISALALIAGTVQAPANPPGTTQALPNPPETTQALANPAETTQAPAGTPVAQSTEMTTVSPSDAPTRVLMVGDSVPFGLARDFPAAAHPQIVPVIATKLGCALLRVQHSEGTNPVPTPPECLSGSPLTPEQVKDAQPTQVLIFLGLGELYDASLPSGVKQVGTTDHAQWLNDQLDALVSTARTAPVQVALVNIGCYHLPGSNTAEIRVGNDEERVAAVNGEILDYGGRRGVRVIDLHDALCASGYTDHPPGVTQLRVDGVHFTAEGAAYVWQFLAAQLREQGPG